MYYNKCQLHPKKENEFVCLTQHNCQRRLCSECFAEHQDQHKEFKYTTAQKFFEKSIEKLSDLDRQDKFDVYLKELKKKISESEKINQNFHKNLLEQVEKLFQQIKENELMFYLIKNKLKGLSLEELSNKELDLLIKVDLSEQILSLNKNKESSAQRISNIVNEIINKLKKSLEQGLKNLSSENILFNTQPEQNLDIDRGQKKLIGDIDSGQKLLKTLQIPLSYHSQLFKQLSQIQMPKDRTKSTQKQDEKQEPLKHAESPPKQTLSIVKQQKSEPFNKQRKEINQQPKYSQEYKNEELVKQPEPLELSEDELNESLQAFKQSNQCVKIFQKCAPKFTKTNAKQNVKRAPTNQVKKKNQQGMKTKGQPARKQINKYSEDSSSDNEEVRMDILEQRLNQDIRVCGNMQLITKQMLGKIYKILQNMTYGQTIAIDIDIFNQFDSLILLFEEFLIQGKIYFLDYEQTDTILKIFQKVIQNKDCSVMIQEFYKNLEIKLLKLTNKRNFGEQKIYFPFHNNQFEFYMIEKDPAQKQLRLYFEKKPSLNIRRQELQEFLSIFQQILSCQDFEVSEIILESLSQGMFTKLLNKDEIYSKCLLTLFTILYEEISCPTSINMNTISGAFWVLHHKKEFSKLLQEDEKYVRNFFQKILIEGQKNESSIGLAQVDEMYSLIRMQNLEQQIKRIYEEFLKNQQQNQFFVSVNLRFPQSRQQLIFYVHLQRGAQKNIIKIFSQRNQDQISEQMRKYFVSDEEYFIQQAYQDYSRHNVFQEYSEITLGALYHLVTKRNLKAEEAMANLVFSLVPYNLIITKQE